MCDLFCDSVLVDTYKALVRSLLEHGSPAWMQWLSKTQMERLEKLQIEAARRCSCLLASSPTDVVLAEAGLETLAERVEVTAAIAWEKGLAVEEANPRGAISNSVVRKRLKKRSWRDSAKSVVTTILCTEWVRK